MVTQPSVINLTDEIERERQTLTDALGVARWAVQETLQRWSERGNGCTPEDVASLVDGLLHVEGELGDALSAAAALGVLAPDPDMPPSASEPSVWDIEQLDDERRTAWKERRAKMRLRRYTRGRDRLEDDPGSGWRELALNAEQLKRKNPDWEWGTIARRLRVASSTLRKYRTKLGQLRRAGAMGIDPPKT